MGGGTDDCGGKKVEFGQVGRYSMEAGKEQPGQTVSQVFGASREIYAFLAGEQRKEQGGRCKIVDTALLPGNISPLKNEVHKAEKADTVLQEAFRALRAEDKEDAGFDDACKKSKIGDGEGGQDGMNDKDNVKEEGQEEDEDTKRRLEGCGQGDGGCTTATTTQQNAWTSFLPQRQLRVLLVEDDDSTRYVVSALLRNCSYEVTSSSNGSQAWELLEDGANHFDLVLTDVVMPGLSGVGLLAKIMNWDPRKQIPVIMMSSQDSIDVVLKCFQMGASDFLVKPVRKNELKNLWQHVWRRTYSSSGSGSGSVSGTCKVREKSCVGSGNGDGSNEGSGSGSGSGSSGINARGNGSDNGSGTQNELPQLTAGNQRERSGRDRACDRDDAAATSEDHGCPRGMGEDLAIGTPGGDRDLDLNAPEVREEAPTTAARSEELHASKQEERSNVNDETREPSSPMDGNGQGPEKLADLLGSIVVNKAKEAAAAEKVMDVDGGSGEQCEERGGSSSPNKGNLEPEVDGFPILELMLKRPRSEDETDQEERKILRQSGGSAFSRYSTSFGLPLPVMQQPNSLSNITNPGGPFLPMPSYAHGMTQRLGRLVPVSERQERGTVGKDSQQPSLPGHPHIHSNPAQDGSSSGVLTASESHWRTGQQQCTPLPEGCMSYSMMTHGAGPMQIRPMTMSLPPPGMMQFDPARAPYPSHGLHPHPTDYHTPRPQWGAPEANPNQHMATPDTDNTYQPGPPPSHMHHHGSSCGHGHPMHHHSGLSHHHHHAMQQQQSQHRPLPHHPTPQHHMEEGGLHAPGPVRGNPPHMAQPMEATPMSQQQHTGGTSGQPRDGSGMDRAEVGGSGSGGSNERNGNGNRSTVGSNNGSNGYRSNGNGGGHSNGNQSGVLGPLGVLGHGNSKNVGDSGPNGGSSNGQSSGTDPMGLAGGEAAQNPAVNRVAMMIGTVQNREERREEALNKFRQKRKERCFEKKVRYQSRKRLAEQRPRVRGQFVRQAVYEVPRQEQDA
eukprot:TRINITY_DN787_c0_g1_i1.p1 TRINITY_DN787_c0_g1~~TRINITY_DN787_c0_g1_i1.p1  ORF type:complete len:1008 (-),score=244.35 TRINITY_DN787_c0_g1_i1:298-3321(-)